MIFEDYEFDEVLDAIEELFLVYESMEETNELATRSIVNLCLTGK